MKNYCISSVEKFLRRFLEIRGRRIEHREIQIGLDKFHDAVRFENRILGLRQAPANRGQGFGETALLGADPPRALGSS